MDGGGCKLECNMIGQFAAHLELPGRVFMPKSRGARDRLQMCLRFIPSIHYQLFGSLQMPEISAFGV